MTPLTLEADLGAIWLSRDGDQVRIDPHEVGEIICNLLLLHSAIGDVA